MRKETPMDISVNFSKAGKWIEYMVGPDGNWPSRVEWTTTQGQAERRYIKEAMWFNS